MIRKQLAGMGLSENDIEDRLHDAFNAHASCTVFAIQAQAREQGLSEKLGITSRQRPAAP